MLGFEPGHHEKLIRQLRWVDPVLQTNSVNAPLDFIGWFLTVPVQNIGGLGYVDAENIKPGRECDAFGD
jgi:hypothetical protein